MQRPANDPEVQELNGLRPTDPLVANLLTLQSGNGSWTGSALGGSVPGGEFQATAHALTRLGYLGFGADHPAVQRAVAYLFTHQRDDGSWPTPRTLEREGETGDGYTMIPLQTAIPLRGLAACGYATDERAERAYDWLEAQRLEDGAWPTGKAGAIYGYVAGYRRLAHSRWGCRSNTTAALICLALHPTRRTGPAARRALDLLLGRETRERRNVGFEVARTVGVEPPSGYITFHAKFDLALLLDLCWRVGADRSDARVRDLVTYLREAQGPYGLWAYAPRPEASRWVTFDLLRSLSRVDATMDWLSVEPRTPFSAYPRRPKRF
jgi:hypothetical protein